MASIRSIRKRGQDLMQCRVRARDLISFWGPGVSFDSMGDALAFLSTLRQPEHVFVVGGHATRCGTDVQVVDSVAGNCADFRCIKAPRSGWCEVGDVEHNLMRRYQPLSPDEVDSMLAQAPDMCTVSVLSPDGWKVLGVTPGPLSWSGAPRRL